MKRILVFNSGSSSLKYKLFQIIENEICTEEFGEVSGIGTPDGPKNHIIALSILFNGFGRQDGYLNKIDNLVAIGHRVVHGGDKFRKTEQVTPTMINELKKYIALAPLHNLPIIEVMEDTLKNSYKKNHRPIPNYAVFDTSFYKDLPDVAKIYPIPYSYYEDEKIQRFGFHGISHQYAMLVTQNKLNLKDGNIVSVHLGSGCSITAIKDGQPIDTSMGFTPCDGLMMSTRSGSLDPGILAYLMQEKKFNFEKIFNFINNESGLLGISEVTGEMKDLLYLAGLPVEDEAYQPSARIQGLPDVYREKSILAIKMYIYHIKKYIGAYAAILGKIDTLIFTGKIGFGSSYIRQEIISGIENILGNAKISVVATDEEKRIAEEILENLPNK